MKMYVDTIRGSKHMHSLLIAVCFCSFLMGPMLLYCAEFGGANLPDWLTGADAIYLYGSKQNPIVAEKLTVPDFVQGSLQGAVEDDLDLHIPCKVKAMLGNAVTQRMAIAGSDAIFAWPACPTYYGCSTLYFDELDILGPSPARQSLETDKGLQSFASRCSSFAQDYPEVTFTIILTSNPAYQKVNPAHNLVSNALDIESVASLFSGYFDRLQNTRVVVKPFDDLEEMVSCGYATDAHWNGYGAVRTYNALANALGEDEIAIPYDEECLDDGYIFNGKLARSGLCLLEKKMCTNHFWMYPTYTSMKTVRSLARNCTTERSYLFHKTQCRSSTFMPLGTVLIMNV